MPDTTPAYINDERNAAAKLYLYRAAQGDADFAKSVRRGFDASLLRDFRDLGQFFSEVLEYHPPLILLDLPALNTQVLGQLKRLRALRGADKITIIIRSQTLSDTDLSDLFSLQITDTFLSLVTHASIVQRLRSIMAGELASGKRGARVRAVSDKLAAAVIERNNVAPSPELVERFERQYGVTLLSPTRPGPSAMGELWGVTPVNAWFFIVYAARFSGEPIIAAPQTIRFHSLLHGEGFEKLAPRRALSYLTEQMRIFLQANQRMSMAYCVADIAAAETRVALSGDFLFTWQGTEMGAPVTMSSKGILHELTVSMPAGGYFQLALPATRPAIESALGNGRSLADFDSLIAFAASSENAGPDELRAQTERNVVRVSTGSERERP